MQASVFNMKMVTLSCNGATYTGDVESCLNYFFPYFFYLSSVPLCCRLLDFLSSSLSTIRDIFYERKWKNVIFGQSDLLFPFLLWHQIPYFTSALKQANLRVEHQRPLPLRLQNTGTLSVIVSWVISACDVILWLEAVSGISKLIFHDRGINSDIEKLRSNTPYLIWIL